MDKKPAGCSSEVVAGQPDARDPEDRVVPHTPECIRDKMMDKTLADTFPNSDPPSSIPDPGASDSFATEEAKQEQRRGSERVTRERKTA